MLNQLMSARQIEVVYERNLMQKCQMSMYAGPPSRSDVNPYVTANVYYVTFRYPCT